jgi:hypothetical protein
MEHPTSLATPFQNAGPLPNMSVQDPAYLLTESPQYPSTVLPVNLAETVDLNLQRNALWPLTDA